MCTLNCLTVWFCIHENFAVFTFNLHFKITILWNYREEKKMHIVIFSIERKVLKPRFESRFVVCAETLYQLNYHLEIRRIQLTHTIFWLTSFDSQSGLLSETAQLFKLQINNKSNKPWIPNYTLLYWAVSNNNHKIWIIQMIKISLSKVCLRELCPLKLSKIS